ncbi:phosphohistidine phosphatase SixA [Sansalvadorimonas sp. 2012CJ34-2]|uniref:Phosphohistidine phosphatase SixA n=1 Tax=Parendozoicomonas callyspongiae TaxID=2942213 RepID=A0ABT0PBJ8_9GAMM|nr:phosphohistidine phosphatase SixA [Sansalvadorimonas sp. 2012CJ34-2]MCL6268658.1 phosphohistidine phosphatase SixA [Sansalvadorimonas sp. 2012CJ34-2]
MKLFVMRHGEAAPWADSDAERPLTPFGQNQAGTVAEQLGKYELTTILASPYKRAQQTAGIVQSVINGPEIITSRLITPDLPPEPVIDALPETGVVLLVAHMPLVSRLTGLLTDGVTNMGIPFSTAMIAELEMEFPAAGMASLQRIFTP